MKKFTKKITAGITALSLGICLSVATPAEAIGIGDLVGVGIAAAQMTQVRKEVDRLNTTQAGQDELYNKFRENYGVVEDADLNYRFKTIMDNLTNAVAQVDSSINDKPYKYFISADKSLNAACGMGHVMMVNVGTFSYLSSDDEIAAIVGHEMGHGQKSHTAKGIKSNLDKTLGAQIGAAIAGGGVITNIIANVALNNSIAHSDRKNETEADNLAWEYIQHTNYNLGSCAAVMQKLAELYGEKNNSSILNPSDHPDTDKRRDNYANKLYEYSNKHASAKDGVITINNQTFMTVAATDSMSSAERAYFVLGNIAAAYHNNHNNSNAYVQNGVVMLGAQAIIQPASGDEDAYTLAERLNAIK